MAFKLPQATDVTRPFWQGVADGELVLQWCDTCGRNVFYPRLFCQRCYGPLAWRATDGCGTVIAYTIAHRGNPALMALGPYPVGIVDVDGARLFTVFDKADQLEVGRRVEFSSAMAAEQELATPFIFRIQS